MLNQPIQKKICDILGKRTIANVDTFKTVWSGFGSLHRIEFNGCHKPVVVKSICEPNHINHPKGWSSHFASARKLQSYRVEQAFYREFAKKANAKTPAYLGFIEGENTQYLLLEDLAAAGYHDIVEPDIVTVKKILVWLADFHAQHLNTTCEGLWRQGSYWHLATRPDELTAMSHTELKKHARALDCQLQNCVFQTLIHGDAKLANFMQSATDIAGYDFQYVGRGVGIVDVMLLISSAFTSDQCFAYEKELLAHYEAAFLSNCGRYSINLAEEVIDQWLALYPIAWADFARFLNGWSPGHWKLHDYAWHQVQQAVQLVK